MFSFKTFLNSFIISSFLIYFINADCNNCSVILMVDELEEINSQHKQFVLNYMDDRTKEINTLINKSPSRWDFIRSLGAIQPWWNIDLDSRMKYTLSKLPNVLLNVDESFQNLKNKFNNSLNYARAFWIYEVDKKLQPLRKNPEMFNGLIREPIFTTEHPPLVLNPKNQPIYESQMRNLTNIATTTKDIVEAVLSQVKCKLPDNNNISYFSTKTKFNMIINNIKQNQYLYIDSTRIFATERISGAWRGEEQRGPTQDEFDKEYINLASYGTHLVKNLNETINNELKDFNIN